MLACSSRAAEPIHPTRLYDQLNQCPDQTKEFLLLHYFAAGQSDSQVGTLAALFPYFWSHSPVDFENLL